MSLAEIEAALGPPTDRHGDIFWYFDDEVEVHFDGQLALWVGTWDGPSAGVVA